MGPSGRSLWYISICPHSQSCVIFSGKTSHHTPAVECFCFYVLQGAVSAHPGNPRSGESEGDIIAKQQRLHEEATVAYIQVDS